jgi:hypothetical protein
VGELRPVLRPARGRVCRLGGERLQPHLDGSTIVVLADVYGAQGAAATDYEPEHECQSTDGGATFTIMDGGLSVSEGTVSDTAPLNAVILPGASGLGYGWNSAAGNVGGTIGAVPTFNAFPLASPPECSLATCYGSARRSRPACTPGRAHPAGIAGRFGDARRLGQEPLRGQLEYPRALRAPWSAAMPERL